MIDKPLTRHCFWLGVVSLGSCWEGHDTLALNGEPFNCWELLIFCSANYSEFNFQLFFGPKWLSVKEGWEGRRGKELGRIPWSCMVLT